MSCRSSSCKELPRDAPIAPKNVFAMPPPMTSTSSLPTRFSKRSILVDTFAPPTTAPTGHLGVESAASSAVSSACIRRPAQLGNSLARLMVLACARCAAENASLQNTSPSAARRAAKAASLASSPAWKRMFSNRTMPAGRVPASAASKVSTNVTG